ncbi:MAG: RadC family protein [Oscillospiraceae bacterium]
MSTDTEKGIHTGHRQRMREKFQADLSLSTFSEIEILEMLLYYCGYTRGDTNVIAHRLLNRYGSIAEMLKAPLQELKDSQIVSENPAIALKFFDSVINYINRFNSSADTYFCNISQIESYVSGCFGDEQNELVKVLLVNGNGYICKQVTICSGISKKVKVDIRLIAKAVIDSGESYFFLAHNHPNGSGYPSDDDVYVTKILINILRELDIHLLDHYIVGKDNVYSLRSLGLIHDHEA